MTWFDASFGSDKAGIGTVGYRFYKADGTDSSTRTTTGVVEIAGGAYGVDVAAPADAVGIEWDTGEGTPIYAHESISGTDNALLEELWQLQGLDASNPMTATKTSRTAGSISLSITGDCTTTSTVTRL